MAVLCQGKEDIQEDVLLRDILLIIIFRAIIKRK